MSLTRPIPPEAMSTLRVIRNKIPRPESMDGFTFHFGLLFLGKSLNYFGAWLEEQTDDKAVMRAIWGLKQIGLRKVWRSHSRRRS